MRNTLFYGGGFWFLCIAFTADMIIPSGAATGLFYVLPVAVGVLSPSRAYVYWAAGAGTVLTAVGYFVSPLSGEPWKDITNRVLAVLIIWVAAWLCLRRPA